MTTGNVKIKHVISASMIFFCLFFPFNARAGGMRIFVSIVPQKYFVERIGKNLVSVSVMVKPGANPATYEPSPSQMAAIARARAYFAIGVPFESAWLPRIAAAAASMKIIHTDLGIEKKPVNRNNPAAKIKGGIPDPHIWLSPPLVMLQARTIAAALSGLDPGNAPEYRANFRAFINEITATDNAISKRLASLPRPVLFLTFHPSWGYFADAYGLEQISIEADGKTPGPAALGRLIGFAKKKKIRAVMVEPQFSTRAAAVIARAINGKTITADPLAYDWKNNLIKFADAIAGASR